MQTLILQRCVFGACGMVGSIVAILGDIQQKGETSAVSSIAKSANVALGINLTTLTWALVLTAIGVALSFIFDPRTKKMAFYAGASVIALVLTATPYQSLPSSPTTSDATTSGAHPGDGTWLMQSDLFQHAYFEPSLAFKVSVVAPANGKASSVTLTFHDTGTGQTWQRSVTVRPGQTTEMSWNLPQQSGATNRRIEVRTESAAYNFDTRRAEIGPRDTQARIMIALKPASSPLFLRKLGQQLGF